jgi:hypothetical protein
MSELAGSLFGLDESADVVFGVAVVALRGIPEG